MNPSKRRMVGILRLKAVLLASLAGLLLTTLSPIVPSAAAASSDPTIFDVVGMPAPGPPNQNGDKNPLSDSYATDPSGAHILYVASYGVSNSGEAPDVPGPGGVWAFDVDPLSPFYKFNKFVPLGATRPTWVAHNPNTNQVFVARQWQGDVAILTGTTAGVLSDPVLDTTVWLDFGARPYFAGLNTTTNKVYVPRTAPHDVAVINGNDPNIPITDPAVPKIPIEVPGTGVAVDPTTNKIYVARPDYKDIAIIDGNTNGVVGQIAGHDVVSTALAINPATHRLYAANPCTAPSGQPYCTPNPDTPYENTVSVIDTQSATEMFKLGAGIGIDPGNIDVNPVTDKVYVTNHATNDMSIIDGPTSGVIARVAVPGIPSGITHDPATNNIYVLNQGNSSALGGGQAGAITFMTDPPSSPPSPTIDFAEGTTRAGFQEYITLFATDAPNVVDVTYSLGPGQGGPIVKTYTLAGGVRGTLNVNAAVGADKDVSTRITSRSGRPFFAERPMYFNGVVIGSSDGTTKPGYSNFFSDRNNPMNEFYFVEGTTRPGFEEYLTLLNSGSAVNPVDITYFFGPGQGAPITTPGVPLLPNQRTTINVGSVVGANKDVTIHVKSPGGAPFFAERPMYFNGGVIGISGGHNGLGLPKDPFTDTVLPEGTTQAGFRTFYTLFSEVDQRVVISDLMSVAADPNPQQQNTVYELDLPANQRVTVEMSNIPGIGANKDAAARITSCGNNPDCKNLDPGLPFYAERPMYFSNVSIGGAATGGTVNTGITANSVWQQSMQTDYYFAEGTNRALVENYALAGGFQGYLTLTSPDMTQTVNMTLSFGPGTTPVKTQFQLNKGRRTTVDLNLWTALVPPPHPDSDYSIRVESTIGSSFYVERPMYFFNVVNGTRGGTVSSGQHS